MGGKKAKVDPFEKAQEKERMLKIREERNEEARKRLEERKVAEDKKGEERIRKEEERIRKEILKRKENQEAEYERVLKEAAARAQEEVLVRRKSPSPLISREIVERLAHEFEEAEAVKEANRAERRLRANALLANKKEENATRKLSKLLGFSIEKTKRIRENPVKYMENEMGTIGSWANVANYMNALHPKPKPKVKKTIKSIGSNKTNRPSRKSKKAEKAEKATATVARPYAAVAASPILLARVEDTYKTLKVSNLPIREIVLNSSRVENNLLAKIRGAMGGALFFTKEEKPKPTDIKVYIPKNKTTKNPIGYCLITYPTHALAKKVYTKFMAGEAKPTLFDQPIMEVEPAYGEQRTLLSPVAE